MDPLNSYIGESYEDPEGPGGNIDQKNYPKVCLFCSKTFNNSQDFKEIKLKTICQDFKIDLDKVAKFNVDTHDDYGLLLCEQCTSVTSKLSSLFKELEVTQMWINHFLRSLMEILISGEGTTNNITRSSGEDTEGERILRELIIEKCNSTLKTTNCPNLQLERCQLPVTPIKQELEAEDENEKEAVLSSDELPISSQLPNCPIKLEEILINEDNIQQESPHSSLQLQPIPVEYVNVNSQSSSSSLQVQKEHFVNNVMKRKPFWFIKPTDEITPQGKKRTKYNCPFCQKVMHGFSACKFHIIGKHPEHIFPFQQLAGLNAEEFSSCCSTTLEEEVTPICNEDGEGSYTTFDCKYCPIGDKTRKADKRVVQVHMIRCHYDKLVDRLKGFQGLRGTEEFEGNLGKYLEKPRDRKRNGNSGDFRRKWRCDECGCGFPNRNRLEVHIQLHGERVGDTGEKRVKIGVESEASSTVQKKSPCEICGKVFSCGYSLWRHKRISCLGKGLLGNQDNEKSESGTLFDEEEMEEEEHDICMNDDMDQEINNELEKDPLS